ncbi:MAG: aminopeptidase P family protein [Bacteroidales bacterium]|nr:aminopeptidase P family protein [Bacteroidales bacterium]
MMFPSRIYIERRASLKKFMGKGIILLPGNPETSMNYKANYYPFRQDSTFLYYFGLDIPDLAAIIDAESGDEIIYGNDASIEDIIWMGEAEILSIRSERSGVHQIRPFRQLEQDVGKARSLGRKLHYLPPYREQRRLQLARYGGMKYEEVDRNASAQLIRAIVSQRSVKDHAELQEMEKTMSDVTCKAYYQAVQVIKPGNHEYNVAGALEGTVLQHNCRMAYPVICTIHGEILHNNSYGHLLQSGQLLLIDAGAESEMHYATDITRTYPVGGKFTRIQKDVYNIVLNAQVEAIAAIRPEISYRDIHFKAARTIAEGLKDIGLLKGNTDDVVQLGAHALFFPHGLGHMIGLDVHDMEDLGEDYVGYDREFKRSEQFGTAYLRMAKRLLEGNVVTVEPGIYFIDALIDKWREEKRFNDFINYEALEKFRGFGGIRIEDNVAVTREGHHVIGKPIPKAPDELENMLGG